MRRFFCAVFLLTALSVLLRGVLTSPPASVSADARAPNAKWLLIEVEKKRLTLYSGTQTLKVYPIATGTRDTPTPLGAFRITGRFQSELSGFGTRFLRLNVPWGQYGIHGTNKPGSIGGSVSHGCVRLTVRDAEELYALVPGGALTVVEGGPYGPFGAGLRTLQSGDRGSDVMETQKRLALLGFYTGRPDGVYGRMTSAAVLKARGFFGLSGADRVDDALYRKLGVLLFE